jgi:hypothetical protein
MRERVSDDGSHPPRAQSACIVGLQRGHPQPYDPLPMIPLVYYTSKTKFMGTLVNHRTTIVLSLMTVGLIVFFNFYLLTTLL